MRSEPVGVTTIDFYTHVADCLGVAARLAGQVFAAHGSVRVLTPDALTTEELDRLLWMVPATAFVPHCRMGSALAAQTPVWIDHTLEHDGRAEVLINLHSAPPPFFSRFERLAEIVPNTEAGALAGRERYRFYRDRGYQLRAHNLSGQG